MENCLAFTEPQLRPKHLVFVVPLLKLLVLLLKLCRQLLVLSKESALLRQSAYMRKCGMFVCMWYVCVYVVCVCVCA